MNITIHSSASRRCRVAWVAQVQEDKPTTACRVSRPCTNDIGKIRFRVGEHVVRAAIWEFAIETSKVGLGIEDFRAAIVDVQEL